jgi:hypothetical protein
VGIGGAAGRVHHPAGPHPGGDEPRPYIENRRISGRGGLGGPYFAGSNFIATPFMQ